MITTTAPRGHLLFAFRGAGGSAIYPAEGKPAPGTDPSHFKGANRPVESVSWNDCQEFCRKFTALLRGGVKMRLPTEAEWEYVCRAGTTTEYHFGDVINADIANYDGNYSWNGSPKGKYRKRTTDVGSFPANPWGLYDVHGNVWEWCFDLDSNGYAVLRGGSWYDVPESSRAAYRDSNSPSNRNYNVGFRVSLHLE